MWLIRKILALVGWRRIMSYVDKDGKIQEAQIVNESRSRFCIRVFHRIALFYGDWCNAWIQKSDPHIREIIWTHWPLRVWGVIGLIVGLVLIVSAVGGELHTGNCVVGLTGLALMGGSIELLEHLDKKEERREKARRLYQGNTDLS